MTVQTIIYGEVLGAGLLAELAIPAATGPLPVIPVDQADRMTAALAEREVHHRYLHYTDRGHIGLTEDFVIEESLDFIREIEREGK